MKTLPEPLKILINNLKRLPGIGEKTAERLSYYIIKQEDEYLNEFSDILGCIKHDIIFGCIFSLEIIHGIMKMMPVILVISNFSN